MRSTCAMLMLASTRCLDVSDEDRALAFANIEEAAKHYVQWTQFLDSGLIVDREFPANLLRRGPNSRPLSSARALEKAYGAHTNPD